MDYWIIYYQGTTGLADIGESQPRDVADRRALAPSRTRLTLGTKPDTWTPNSKYSDLDPKYRTRTTRCLVRIVNHITRIYIG
jgi:hypothetical protein